MKKSLLLLLIILSFAFVLFSCEKQTQNKLSKVKQADIDYRDYTDNELITVKSLLENRMSELGIAVLGIGEDWVNIQVYEFTDELKNYLFANIFPQYRSFVVRIEIIPEGTEIRLT